MLYNLLEKSSQISESFNEYVLTESFSFDAHVM